METLLDAQGRRISYLRLSVTDRCNFRCVYCSPAETGRRDLTREELARLVRTFAALGVRRVRLTGGEPLFRPDIVEIAAEIARTPGIDELCLSTNGSALAELAAPLRAAGVHKLNVSLDSLDEARFARLSHGGRLRDVLLGLEAARRVRFPEVAVNCVVLRGENEDEAPALVRWAWERGLTPRFIELMPFAHGTPVPMAEILARLEAAGLGLGRPAERQPHRGPAVYREGDGGRVGFIGALTQNFCEGCNRLRVSARGELQACLGGRERVPLARLLAPGSPDAPLVDAIRGALSRKEDGHHFLEPQVQGKLLSMMGIGG
ncbi:MAG: GTP 3',8-cyclase MoaA [Deltaproteobacteria bacterium]